jgi:hypothetical protein
VGVNWAFRDLSRSIAPGVTSRNIKVHFEFICRCLTPQPSRFDGKSDGKNFFVILFLICTVKPDLKSLKSLQIKEFFALKIVGLGNS